MAVTAQQVFAGTPSTIAAELNDLVQNDATDGFIIGLPRGADGLDPFVDKVVPLLQERGVFRTEYEADTLRGHLGLADLKQLSARE